MSVCLYCDRIGGTHSRHCPAPHEAAPYEAPKPEPKARIEITGNIVVHHPVKKAA
jgi:hypothetical protein